MVEVSFEPGYKEHQLTKFQPNVTLTVMAF